MRITNYLVKVSNKTETMWFYIENCDDISQWGNTSYSLTRFFNGNTILACFPLQEISFIKEVDVKKLPEVTESMGITADDVIFL